MSYVPITDPFDGFCEESYTDLGWESSCNDGLGSGSSPELVPILLPDGA
jgi:hypothetical protein